MSATVREYVRKCREHVHAAWQAGEVIMTFLLAIAAGIITYFGLSIAPVAHWVVYAGTALLTTLYFVCVIQFQVWRSEARRIESLERQLTPAIAVDFRPDSDGFVRTRTEIHHVIDVTGQQRVAKRDDEAVCVSITLRCLSQKTIPNCAAFITKLEKGTVQGGSFVEIPIYDAISLTPEPINLHPRVPRQIGVLKAGKIENKLDGATPWTEVSEFWATASAGFTKLAPSSLLLRARRVPS